MNTLPIKLIQPGDNDRTVFDQIKLEELAESVRTHGIIEPIVVRKVGNYYEIVAGERRYRAAKIAGLKSVPVVIRELNDEQAAEVMLIENVSRADLDPIDEALAYSHRIERFGWTPQECARRAGVSEIKVLFRLKLLTLRPDVQQLVKSGNLTVGYAVILADAGLDANRQSLAIAALRNNPRPVPGWFRSICNQYKEQQAQQSLFDLELLLPPQPIEKTQPETPPHPSTHTAPSCKGSLSNILTHQIAYWTGAAEEWRKIGKPFKSQECQAAAQALQQVTAYL